jgi:hypothetical protein
LKPKELIAPPGGVIMSKLICYNRTKNTSKLVNKVPWVNKKTGGIRAKKRSFACRAEILSLAINHLCSEMIELLRYCQNLKEKKLTVKDVLAWMSDLDCSNEDMITIKNLFDRHNNNGISYAGLIISFLRRSY